MKVSIQLELTSGTSAIARADARTMKSLTESLYWPLAFSLRWLRTLREGGKEGRSERREGVRREGRGSEEGRGRGGGRREERLGVSPQFSRT